MSVFQYSDYSNSVLNNVQLNGFIEEKYLVIVGHNGAGNQHLLNEGARKRTKTAAPSCHGMYYPVKQSN